MSESVASRADVEVLRSIPDHEALAREWTALWQRSPNATTFQRPEWLLAWLHLFQPESLWSVALRRGSRLVGLVPLFVEEGVLFPIGAGVTDYLDGLFDQSEPDAAAAFADFLRSGGEWASLDFEQLRPGSPLLSESLFAGLQREVIAENCSPVLQLPASRDLREVVSSGMLKNLRYARRQLEKAGRVEWLVADESNLGELLDALFRTHASRWEMKGQSGMLAGDEIQSMHREVAAGPSAEAGSATPVWHAPRGPAGRRPRVVLRNRDRIFLPPRIRARDRAIQPRRAARGALHRGRGRAGSSHRRFSARPGAVQVPVGGKGHADLPAAIAPAVEAGSPWSAAVMPPLLP